MGSSERRARPRTRTCSGHFVVAAAISARSRRCEYRLHPVTESLSGSCIYPLDQGRDVMRFYRDFCATLPDEAEAFAALLTHDGEPVVAMLLGYNGSIEVGERVLAPARQFGSPIADLVGPMPYGVRQTLIDDPLREARSAPLLAIGLRRAIVG